MNNKRKTIIDEWAGVKAPLSPELRPVEVDSAITALLILDIQNQNCSTETAAFLSNIFGGHSCSTKNFLVIHGEFHVDV